MNRSRRFFLQTASAAALRAAVPSGLATSLGALNAQAADTEGYKALVCVFFLGGMDCHDTLLPYDQASYNEFAAIRGDLIAQANGNRDLENLLPLSPSNSIKFGGRQFALPPQMPGLHGLFESGNAAIMANVGPLIMPTNRTQFLNESVTLPARLFSHNDQQSTWQSSSPEGAQYGWGGRFADAVVASGANDMPEFTSITGLGNDLFLTGIDAIPYQVSAGGAPSVEILNFLQTQANPASIPMISFIRSDQFMGSNLLELDMANAGRKAYDANELYNDAYSNAAVLETPFPGGFLSVQLRAVAQTISIRQELGANRQIFFVGIGGFDTHDEQATDLPALHTQIDGALSAFFNATEELGVSNDVTLFTASDFGRTLAVNGDGTDHGWGAHHFVVGGAVQGRVIYGDVPEPVFGHDQDAGGGRLIPTTSVEQFADPMGRWFGLSDQEVADALPNLANFTKGSPALFGA